MSKKSGRATSPRSKSPTPRKRDAARTKETILKAAMKEFCGHGFDGARVDQIAKRSRSNMRMIYHYFGSKAGLYVAVLERVYEQIRNQERSLRLTDFEPVEGMEELVDFTFSFLARRVDFIALMNNENLLRAKYLKRSKKVQTMTLPLVDAIDDLLRRGSEAGVFRRGVDPIQLYVSIVAQSYFHISNRYTLSSIFAKDLSDKAWLQARRKHARDLILSYLAPESKRAEACSARSASRPPRIGGGPRRRAIVDVA